MVGQGLRLSLGLGIGLGLGLGLGLWVGFMLFSTRATANGRSRSSAWGGVRCKVCVWFWGRIWSSGRFRVSFYVKFNDSIRVCARSMARVRVRYRIRFIVSVRFRVWMRARFRVVYG
jgi:hypothetical protein